jgi:hypothetical protein
MNPFGFLHMTWTWVFSVCSSFFPFGGCFNKVYQGFIIINFQNFGPQKVKQEYLLLLFQFCDVVTLVTVDRRNQPNLATGQIGTQKNLRILLYFGNLLEPIV